MRARFDFGAIFSALTKNGVGDGEQVRRDLRLGYRFARPLAVDRNLVVIVSFASH